MKDTEAVSKAALPEDIEAQSPSLTPSQMASHCSSASPTYAGTAGSNPATGRATALGENVPQAQELSRSQNINAELEIESDEEEEDSEDEWDNYWPPSPPSSDSEDSEESEDDADETESDHTTQDTQQAQTSLPSQLMLSPGRELLRAVMTTSTNERDFPQLPMGCSLSPNPDQLEMSKSDEAITIQSHPVQVFIRYGKDVGEFMIHDITDLWANIRKRWSNPEEGYELTPRFDATRNDAEYFLIKRVNSSNLESSKSELVPKKTAQNAQIQVVMQKDQAPSRFEVSGKDDRKIPDDSISRGRLKTSFQEELCQVYVKNGFWNDTI
jgi:hypothetical protein